MYMEEVAYIGGKYKPLSKNKINDIILNGESLIKNKVVDLTNVIGSGGGNVDLSKYVTKTGEDTITVNTDNTSDSGLIVQYGTDDSITNTTNITPQGFATSYKSGSTDMSAIYSILGMTLISGDYGVSFDTNALTYSNKNGNVTINYADILTSASLDNYAKLDANNTFTGNNTFNSNLISQVLNVEDVDPYNCGYTCTIEVEETTDAETNKDTFEGAISPFQFMLVNRHSKYPSYPTGIACSIINALYPTLSLVQGDIEHSVSYTLDINTNGISLAKSTTSYNLFALNIEGNDNCCLTLNNNDTTTGIRFYSKYIKFANNTTLNYSDIATKVTTTESSDTAITLKPNANVDITPTAATAITIAKPTDTTMVNIYSCTVNTKTSNEVTIALADTEATITWDDTPSFEAGKLYEISVRYTPSGYFGLIHSWSL